MEEIWKEIKETGGAYQVSNLGNVKNSKFNRIVKSHAGDRYANIRLFLSKGIILTRRVHRLVAEAFIPNPQELPIVMHKDDNTLNNNSTNLEWGSAKDNIRDCYAKGRDNSGIKQMRVRIKELEKELNFYKEKFGSLN